MIKTQQYIKLNTGAKEIQQVNPDGPDNSKSIRLLQSNQYIGLKVKESEVRPKIRSRTKTKFI